MSQRINKPWSAEVTMPDGSRQTVQLNEFGDLYLGGGTLPPGTALPKGLKTLFLDGGTLPPGTVLPEGLRGLYLGGGTLPAGTALPKDLYVLDLGGGTLPPGMALPKDLYVLNLGGGTLPPGTALPKGLGRLILGGGTLPPGTALPKGLGELYLDGGTLSPGTALPEGLKTLNLGGGTLPAGVALPSGLRALYLDGGTLPQGTAISERCKVRGAGPEGIYGPAATRSVKGVPRERLETPMMREWAGVAESQPQDAIVLWRLGDFWEAFGDDAKVLNDLAGLTLIPRKKVPMAGVPYHASDATIEKLNEAGYKVVLAERQRSGKVCISVRPATRLESLLASDPEAESETAGRRT